MADIHPIRLRGPWKYQVIESFIAGETNEIGVGGSSPGTIQMPSDWGESLGSDFRGRVRYERSFGCPSALEPHESVFLVFEAIDAGGNCYLNGEPLGIASLASGPARFNVTARLRERNVLIVEVTHPILTPEEEAAARPGRVGLPGGIWGEVRLEICSGS